MWESVGEHYEVSILVVKYFSMGRSLVNFSMEEHY
jgi:hypothetical protein